MSQSNQGGSLVWNGVMYDDVSFYGRGTFTTDELVLSGSGSFSLTTPFRFGGVFDVYLFSRGPFRSGVLDEPHRLRNSDRGRLTPSIADFREGSPHRVYRATAVRAWTNLLHTSSAIWWDERV